MPTCDADTVFLELKKKIGGIVSKRRAIMTYIQATDFIDKGIFPELNTYEDRQVMNEIAAFMSRYGVKPKVFISYEREAFFEKTNPELRVSFDRNILTRRENVSLKEGDFGIDLLEDDKVLMEIKCDGHIPLWLSSLLSEMKLFKTNFSKYGTEYRRFYSRYRINKSA
jgi:VTC domain.